MVAARSAASPRTLNWYIAYLRLCLAHFATVISSYTYRFRASDFLYRAKNYNSIFFRIFVAFKLHLTPKHFSAKTNPLVIQSIRARKFVNLVESSIFYAISKSRLKCCATASVLESEAAVANTSTQEPNTVAPQSALCICSRKWKTKPIVPIYFGT